MNITTNFGLTEFACHDGQAYPVDNVEDGSGIPTGWTPPADQPHTWRWTRLEPLALTIQMVRDYIKQKFGLTDAQARMIVDSGYRDLEYDERIYQKHVEAVGGDDGKVAPASRSIHPKGGAGDMVHVTLSAQQVYDVVMEMYEAGLLPYLGGVGLYPNFVHLDVRPRNAGGAHLAIWGGHRPSNVA